MYRIIKRQISSLYKQKYVRKYSITHEGVRKMFLLNPRAQELLLEIISLIKNNGDPRNQVIKAEYSELGFANHSNFNRTRKELIKSRLIFYKNKEYYVNPCYINFYGRRQLELFYIIFKLKTERPVTMTDPTELRLVK